MNLWVFFVKVGALMSLVATIIITIIMSLSFKLSPVWIFFLALISFSIFSMIKKNGLKMILLIILSTVVIVSQMSSTYLNIAPNKSYAVLSLGNGTQDKIGLFEVNDFHYDEIETKYPAESKFVEFSTKQKAYESLDNGTIDLLIIDINEMDSRNDLMEIERIEPVVVQTEVKDLSKDPVLIYVTGLDSDEEAIVRARSDMNILIALNPSTQKMTMVSLARDTYVPLACRENKMDKLTHAGLYGLDCQIRTVENLLGVKVDLYARTHFSGFKKVIDSLGGIDVQVEENFDDFVMGEEHMDGQRTLSFVRARKEVSEGDVGRGENAQRVIEALVKELKVNLSPLKISEMYQAIDTNVSVKQIMRFVNENKEFEVERLVLRGEGDMQETYSQQDHFKYYVSWPDKDNLDMIRNKLEATLSGK